MIKAKKLIQLCLDDGKLTNKYTINEIYDILMEYGKDHSIIGYYNIATIHIHRALHDFNIDTTYSNNKFYVKFV